MILIFRGKHVLNEHQRGAALLLLLGIVAIGTATILMKTFHQSRIEQHRTLSTQLAIAQAKDALIGFAATHGRLPRPAISNLDGHEKQQECQDEKECTGLIPWITLGVGGTDGWDKRLSYSVVPAMTIESFASLSIIPNKVAYTRKSDGKLTYVVGQRECTVASPCAPAVILSHGRNNFGVNIYGASQANQSLENVDEIKNATSFNQFIVRATTNSLDTPGGEFDDQVSWISIRSLYLPMNAAGVLR